MDGGPGVSQIKCFSCPKLNFACKEPLSSKIVEDHNLHIHRIEPFSAAVQISTFFWLFQDLYIFPVSYLKPFPRHDELELEKAAGKAPPAVQTVG